MSAAVGALSDSKSIGFNPDGEKENGERKTGSSGALLPDHGDYNHDDNNEDDGSEKNLTRKFSHASVASNDDDNDDDDEDGDDEHNATKHIVLGPQVTIKEQLEKDKDDESLRRWKEQLLGTVDFSAVGENPEPEVKIVSLAIVSPNRSDLVLPIPFTSDPKGSAFILKDGSRYRLKFTFVVSNNIVSGLKYTNTVWKTGVRVDNTRVMLGTFSPQQEPYTFELEEETTPSGIFARGSYSARTKFVDDDGKCYLDMNYYFEIRKEWAPLST